ncbi:MAG TPA: 5-formyltetrahydrofolate cyclo-ligase [Dongiaceae bacterium]|jgi:5-formyltetrahydrofolate cyclo-ligase
MTSAEAIESPEIAEWKARERRLAAERRAAAFAELPEGGTALATRFHDAVHLPRGGVVSGYWPLAGEMDIRPLLTRIHAAGHPIGLPVVIGKGQPLLFRHWSPGAALIQGSFKVMTPLENVPEVEPQVLLVPLLAFDHDGYRLGYGGGFYDRTLEKRRRQAHSGHPVIAIGVAYAAQETKSLPRGPFDQPLDWIVTEAWARKCR